jgi:hypothetical protein
VFVSANPRRFAQTRVGFTESASVSPNLHWFHQIRLVPSNLHWFHRTCTGFTKPAQVSLKAALVPPNLHRFHQTCTGFRQTCTGFTKPASVSPNPHWFLQTCAGFVKPALGTLVRQSGTGGSKKMSCLKNSLSGFDHLTGPLYGGKFRYFRKSMVGRPNNAAKRLNRKE